MYTGSELPYLQAINSLLQVSFPTIYLCILVCDGSISSGVQLSDVAFFILSLNNKISCPLELAFCVNFILSKQTACWLGYGEFYEVTPLVKAVVYTNFPA